LVFYTISDNNKRKNLPNLIRSYFYAFDNRDDVVLIIKTNNNISQMINDIKKETHQYHNDAIYPKIVVISSYMNEEQICSLHQIGDIFVSASKGESACLPAIDALSFGNPIISPNFGSFPDLLYEQAKEFFVPEENIFRHPGEINTGWLVNGQLSPCFGQNTGIKNLYSGSELWFEVSILDFAKAMQDAYNKWRDNKLGSMQEAARNRALDFSYDKVGAIIKQDMEESIV
jgi:glycosyltransferase involved in cell wall biosynthesis